jgi:hypothetical protein
MNTIEIEVVDIFPIEVIAFRAQVRVILSLGEYEQAFRRFSFQFIKNWMSGLIGRHD